MNIPEFYHMIMVYCIPLYYIIINNNFVCVKEGIDVLNMYDLVISVYLITIV